MRARRPSLPLSFAALAALAPFVGACAGKVGSGGFVSDGGSRDGAPAAAGDGGDAGDAGGATVDCDALNARLKKLRDDAIACCPVCNVIQCAEIIDDLCCPLVVTDKNPELVKVIADVKRHCGPIQCAGDCAPPLRHCGSQDPGNPGQRGVCQ